MSPSKIIELRPDRLLLDPNFNGYKLSLQQIETSEEKLTVPVDRVLPSHDQYSFLHAKLFGMHNHLVGEINNGKGNVYFVDQDWHVQKAYLNEFTQTIEDLVEVWKIPKNRDRQLGDYNVTISFPSDTLAVLSDGTGLVYILDTASRNDDAYWQMLFKDEVLHPNKPFIIQDTCLVVNPDEKSILHCLLVSIEQDSTQSDKFLTCIRWISLSKNTDSLWGIVASREFKCKGGIHYAAFEPQANAFYIVSDNDIECVLDSENPLKEKTSSEPSQKSYLWIQSSDDIILKFRLPSNFEKDALSVSINSSEINLKYNDTSLISGKLYSRVDSELATWTTNEQFLEITLIKNEEDQTWPEFVIGDQNGEQILDPALVEETHERLAHFCSNSEATTQQCPGGTTFNTQQVEDCDFENDQISYFQRVSISHEITHRASIGSHQVLLTAKLEDSLPSAFATRHDVDACLWQPILSEENLLKHVGTLLAFGYVQASKQMRKFSVCSPDLSYSAICEYRKHLFIYRQNEPITSGRLRNRTTGTRVENISQQQVINIPKEEEVLGIYPVNKILFVLTEKTIMAFKM